MILLIRTIVFDKQIDPKIIKNGMKENKRLYKRFNDRINEIKRNLGAGMNYNKDYQDDNHKYNYIRNNLWKKKHPEYGIMNLSLKQQTLLERFKEYTIFCKERGIKPPKKEIFFNHENERRKNP